MSNRLFVVGFFGEVERRNFFTRVLQREEWSDWTVTLLDHTYRPHARSRPDFLPAHYFHHDDYIQDKRWIVKAGLRMLLRYPRVSVESMLLDYFVARRREGFRYGVLKAALLVLRGFGTVAAKLHYGRSLGLALRKGDCVLMFGSNHPSQRLLEAYCRNSGLKLAMVEHGALSGTLHFSPESVTYGLYPMRFPDAFRKLTVSDSDLAAAKRFSKQVEGGRIDQKPQPVDEALLEKLRRLKGKKLLLPGLGNVGGGLYPRMGEASKRVSPLYRSNEHMLDEVLKVAKGKGWTVVFKPHPNVVQSRHGFPNDESLLVCGECSVPELIKECDGIACLGTKLSQTALALGKPVVLTGLYSLSGMGCCYEVERREELEEKLSEALDRGLTKEQKTAYQEYAAREIKYCLFQYKPFTRGVFGRDEAALSAQLKSYFENYGETVDQRYGHPLIVANADQGHF